MKRIPLIAFTLFALTASCFSADNSSQADYPLGTFDFDFARLGADEASQVSAAQAIGFSGTVLRVNNARDFAKLKRYQAAIGDGPFKVHAGLWTVLFDQDLDAQLAHIDTVIPVLKKLDASLWVVLRVKGGKKVEREQIVDFLRALADRTKAAAVEFVMYPHWSGGNPMNISLIESSEEALPYLEEVQNGNVYLSLHICHEIMAGNGHRLSEIAQKIGPWLRLPTINGADVDAVHETDGWDRGIMPLTKGDYDSSQLLEALDSVAYKGPVILHTWALQDEAADHHQTSFKRFQEMKAALGSASVKSKRTSLVALSEAARRSQPSRITAEAWRATRQKIRGLHAEEPGKTAYPMGVFPYDFPRLGEGEASRVSALQSIGYDGMVHGASNAKQLKDLQRYQAAIGDGPFNVHAALVNVKFGKDLAPQHAHIDKVLQTLKELGASLWVVLRYDTQEPDQAEVIDFLQSIADRAEAQGVEVVMYPHYNGIRTRNVDFINSAEEAIPYVEAVDSDNLFISLHLSHELMEGNGERLDEIAAKIKPWLRLPTINGADIDPVNFDRAILPLTTGDYDASKLLRAVKSVGYEGPVILHTWKLDKASADHHHTSFEKFQEMVAALEAEEAPHQTQASPITRAVPQNIQKASLESKIEYLLDRAEIEDIITAYSYSVDTRDMSLHGEIFKESFEQNHKVVSKQDRQNQVGKFLQRFTSTQHLGFPLVIQIEGDTAYATASLHARHYNETGEPLDNYLLFGQYEFWFERTAEGWKISKMAQVNRTRIHTSEAILPE